MQDHNSENIVADGESVWILIYSRWLSAGSMQVSIFLELKKGK